MSAATHCQRCGVELPPPKASDHRRKWCSERCRKAQYAGTCERCGNPTDGSDGYDAPRVCQACNGILGAARAKEAARPQRELVERLWAEGKTCREIGELLGWTGHYLRGVGIGVLRSRGYNLPYRRTPEQLTRITADNGENLRKARAARRQEAAA